MVYNAIGLMSGSSLDGLDIVFAEFNEQAGGWTYEIRAADCFPYSPGWKQKLLSATGLSAKEYLLLHAEYGHYLARETRRFMEKHHLEYQVGLVCSHGHTVFHLPERQMTSQLGDGSAIAAGLKLPVISDLRSLDVANGGQGAPIVPIGEKFLWKDYRYFLNIGGIANLSVSGEPYIAFDVCPANRVLNMLAAKAGREYDDGGKLAASGNIREDVLEKLNRQSYYDRSFPKSLANEFGTDIIYPELSEITPLADALRTCVEHIAFQLSRAIDSVPGASTGQMLVTGGGALNTFLIERMRHYLTPRNITVSVPGLELVLYKEALVMAFIGILRWRQEVNVLSSVTGSTSDSVGGALWNG